MLYEPQGNLLGHDVTSHVTFLNIFFRLYLAYFEGCINGKSAEQNN